MREFALVDEDDNALKWIRMIGTVRRIQKHIRPVFEAAEEEFHVSISKVESCDASVKAPINYVVVGEKIVEVNGLLLPSGLSVEGYQLDRQDAMSCNTK